MNDKKRKVNLSMKKIIVLLSFILLVPFMAKSQVSVLDETVFLNRFIGVTAGVGLISYTGSVSFYADKVNCEPYRFNSKSGSEINLLFGLKAEWKISKHFDFCTSLLYEDRSAKFDSRNFTEPVYVDDERPLELASFKQELNAKINIFSVSPMVKYKPFDFDIGILVGLSFAFIISDELDAKQSILEPAELFFGGIGGREGTIYTGEIESKNSLLLDLKFGLGYSFMLTKQIKLSPEIFYVLPLMRVNSVDNWKISSIQFLISCSYGF